MNILARVLLAVLALAFVAFVSLVDGAVYVAMSAGGAIGTILVALLIVGVIWFEIRMHVKRVHEEDRPEMRKRYRQDEGGIHLVDNKRVVRLRK